MEIQLRAIFSHKDQIMKLFLAHQVNKSYIRILRHFYLGSRIFRK